MRKHETVHTIRHLKEKWKVPMLSEQVVDLRGDIDVAKKHWLKKAIKLLGSITVTCLAVQTIISFGLAPIVRSPGQRTEFFNGVARSLWFLGSGVQSFVLGQSSLVHQHIFLLAYCLPLLIATCVFLALLILLSRHNQILDTDTPRRLFGWTICFAAVSILASPVLVKDFWLSLVWGRMAALGMNPYYVLPPSELLQPLPLGSTVTRMTYGPLWAVISTITMWLAGSHIYLGAILFKLLLAGAWTWSVWLIWQLLKDYSYYHQCIGIAVFGWMPLSVTQIVADGHNDILMIVFLLIWLWGLKRGNAIKSSVALAASVLCKYTTGPLFFLDLLHWRGWRKNQLFTYLTRMLAAGLFIAVTFALFYRSTEFFASTFSMKDWHFYTPADAVDALQQLIGVGWWRSPMIIKAFFVLLAISYVIHYWARPDQKRLFKAVLAIMSGVLFGIAGHIWPWFLLWVLCVAALDSESALSRWVIGVALISPFHILVWIVFPNLNHFYIFFIPALVVYGFSVLWLAFAPRRWFPSSVANN
ncbi:MAG: hypothetical protein AB7P14_28530 [Blastocatellales bacterium]